MRGRSPFLHRKQRGFTLLELVFSVMILGFLSLALTPAFRTLVATKDITYNAEQSAINQKIAAAMLNYAEYGGMPAGTLTAPCHNSTNKVFFSIYNPSYCPGTSGLLDYLQQQGVSLSQVNNDGKAGKNLRVYQYLSSESQTAHMYFQSGPLVYLNYDFGVIYMTNCGQSQPCNQASASSTTPPKSQPTLPGDLTATAGAVRITSSNRGTWAPGTRDIGVTYVSTLPLQKKMLQKTVEQMDRIRSAMTNYYAGLQAANPTSTANFYPQPTDPLQRRPADPFPSGNQGCREGWYSLESSLFDILAQIGLGTESQAGQTAWGGSIEYCRDYDPSGTSPYGTAPHFAALRVNRSLSYGQPPDLDPANNIVISF